MLQISPVTHSSKETTNIVGATGVSEKQSFCLPQTCEAAITCTKNSTSQLALPKTGVIMALRAPCEEEWRLFLTEPDRETEPALVWAEDNPPGLAINQAPVLIEVKPGVQLVRQKQYPVPQDALESIQIHLKHLKDYGIIVPCQSPWKTVPKPGTKD
ncbi:Gag-Pol polyprotein [Plecturocebus cupreus]